ncbi:MAG: carboxylating nicotinate-nucleotide diphosphorylase [Candidatus Altiarchaeota archaeon]
MDDRGLGKRVEVMLREDVGSGDVSSSFTPNKRVKAVIISNSSGFVSGVHELQILFKTHHIQVRSHVKDGGVVRRGRVVLTLEGRARDILSVERTALNILSRMSGITTLTRKYADKLRKAGSKAKVAATRKTTPGFRYFEKRAVVLGGGLPHRMGLYDMVLIKDNHLRLFDCDVRRALDAASNAKKKYKVEIEVASVKDALAAAKSGADILMFDNMQPSSIRKSVALLEKKGLRRRVLLEASGGVTLDNLGAYGMTGVDWISVGRLTHSAEALDFSLEVLKSIN